MASDNPNYKRRNVLKLAGLSLTSLIVGTGAHAANSGKRGPPKHANGAPEREEKPSQHSNGSPNNKSKPPHHANTMGVAVRDNQLEMRNIPSRRNIGSPSDIGRLPDEAVPVPQEGIENALEDFNNAIEAGQFGLEERNGREILVPQGDDPVLGKEGDEHV